MGDKEVWVPISSTNTRREGSRLPTSMRHRSLKNSSRSAAPLDLFFDFVRDVVASGRSSLRSPKPRTQQKGTRPSGSGWPTDALGGLLGAALWPSHLASVSCPEPSLALRCHARRAA